MSELNTERIAHEIGADVTLVSEVLTRLQLVRGNLSDDGFAALVRDVVCMCSASPTRSMRA